MCRNFDEGDGPYGAAASEMGPASLDRSLAFVLPSLPPLAIWKGDGPEAAPAVHPEAYSLDLGEGRA
jgi:hypothetical protein